MATGVRGAQRFISGGGDKKDDDGKKKRKPPSETVRMRGVGDKQTAAMRHTDVGCPPGSMFKGGKCINPRTGAVVMREAPKRQRNRGVV